MPIIFIWKIFTKGLTFANQLYVFECLQLVSFPKAQFLIFAKYFNGLNPPVSFRAMWKFFVIWIWFLLQFCSRNFCLESGYSNLEKISKYLLLSLKFELGDYLLMQFFLRGPRLNLQLPAWIFELSSHNLWLCSSLRKVPRLMPQFMKFCWRDLFGVNKWVFSVIQFFEHWVNCGYQWLVN